MNKNLIFKIITVVLAVVTIVVGSLIVIKNVGDSVVYVENTNALVGDTVELPICIKKNPGIWGGQIIVEYDSKYFSFVSLSNGTVFDGVEVNDTGDSVVLLATQTALKNTNKNGVIATMKFTVKSSATKGDHDFKIDKESNFCKANEKMVEPVLKDGKITIK